MSDSTSEMTPITLHRSDVFGDQLLPEPVACEVAGNYINDSIINIQLSFTVEFEVMDNSFIAMKSPTRQLIFVFLLPAAVILLYPSSLLAQDSGRIEGIVLDAADGTPLVAVNVFLKEMRVGSFTDREGRFRITGLPALEDILVVSHIGHKTEEILIRLSAGETRNLEIRMELQTLEAGRNTVTASRRTESEFRSQKAVSVTDDNTISRRPAGSTADALREQTGILVQKTTAGHGTPIIRGLIGNDILLLYNGVRLNKPTIRFGGNQYMNTVDAEALSRIEVVRGPGSVLYGSDAVGGVVNLITSPPAFTDGETGWRPLLRTRYTSADRGRSLHLGLERRGPNLTARLGVTARSLGNLDPGGEISVQDPTGYDELSAHLITSMRLSPRQTLRLDLIRVSQSEVPRYDQYASGAYETYIYDPQDRFLGMLRYEIRQPFTWLSSIEWNISWQREHEGRIQQRSGSGKLRNDEDIITTAGTFIQATSLVAARHAIRWGFEYYRDRVHSTRVETEAGITEEARGAFPDPSRYSSLGVFLSDDITLSTRTDISIGLRSSRMHLQSPLGGAFGNYQDTFNNVTGNLGFSHHLWTGFNLVGSLSRGFRAPNFNDTVVLKATNSGVDAPSPGLKPEVSTNGELGVKIEWNSSDIELWVYYTGLKDLIDRRRGTYLDLPFFDEDSDGIQDPDEPPIYIKENIQKAFIRGVEFQARWPLSESWKLRTNAFYTYGENMTSGEPMSRIPPLMGLAGIEWNRSGTTLELYVRAASDQRRLSARDIDDTRIDHGGTPGWSDWNLRGRRSFGLFDLSVTLGNLFDHAYKEHGSGVYNPGRHIVIAVRWTTAN